MFNMFNNVADYKCHHQSPLYGVSSEKNVASCTHVCQLVLCVVAELLTSFENDSKLSGVGVR